MRAGGSALPLRPTTPEMDDEAAYAALATAWWAYWAGRGAYPAPVCPWHAEAEFWRWIRAYDAAVARGWLEWLGSLPMDEWKAKMITEGDGIRVRTARVQG